MIHQDRAKSRTRERDQKESYWYIPSAPRVNYSLLIMESIGMMKMAIGEGSPLRQGAGIGSRLVFGGYRGLQWRNFRSRLCSGASGIYRRGWHREQVRGPTGSPRGIGARPRVVGAPSTLVEPSWLPLPTSFAYIYPYTLKHQRVE